MAHDARPRRGWRLPGKNEEVVESLTENDSDDSSDFAKDRLIEYQRNYRLKILLALGLAVVGVGAALTLGLSVGLLERRESLPSNSYRRAQALLSKFPVADGLVRLSAYDTMI